VHRITIDKSIATDECTGIYMISTLNRIDLQASFSRSNGNPEPQCWSSIVFTFSVEFLQRSADRGGILVGCLPSLVYFTLTWNTTFSRSATMRASLAGRLIEYSSSD
jgi:hypothetical protein